jgi:DNA-binding response OmpR family regulator
MRKRIVIMSAEAEFRQALRQLALPDDQYEVFEAETKEEALALCRRRSVHGLIADLIDPGDVDTYKIPPGVAFFQRVTRETSGTASVLMVLPRGFKESGSWDNMFLLNVEYDFIIKPFSIEEFLLRVKRSTNSGERRRHPTAPCSKKTRWLRS